MKSNRFWIIMFCVVILACVSAIALVGMVFADSEQGGVARIYSGGELVRVIDLNRVTEPYEVTVFAAGGGSNVIEVERGCIKVVRADCDGGDCVKQGRLTGAAMPIVCLPHALVIQVEGSTDIDGIVG